MTDLGERQRCFFVPLLFILQRPRGQIREKNALYVPVLFILGDEQVDLAIDGGQDKRKDKGQDYSRKMGSSR